MRTFLGNGFYMRRGGSWGDIRRTARVPYRIASSSLMEIGGKSFRFSRRRP
jgi:hypothetical protein